MSLCAAAVIYLCRTSVPANSCRCELLEPSITLLIDQLRAARRAPRLSHTMLLAGALAPLSLLRAPPSARVAPRWRPAPRGAAGGHGPTKQDQAGGARAEQAKNVRREDMVTLRPQSEVAVGLNRAEGARSTRPARAASARRVRHFVQSEEMQRGLHDMLKGGADFTELARASSTASTREKGGEIGRRERRAPRRDPPEGRPRARDRHQAGTSSSQALGRHLVQVDVFQTLQVDLNPRTRAPHRASSAADRAVARRATTIARSSSCRRRRPPACWAPRARAAAAATRWAGRCRPATAWRAARSRRWCRWRTDGVTGCQMNWPTPRGWRAARRWGLRRRRAVRAQVVVLNTCSIRDTRRRCSYWPHAQRKGGEDMAIIVAGCVAQQEGEELMRAEIDMVMGPQYANRLGDLLEGASTATRSSPPHPPTSWRTPRSRSALTTRVGHRDLRMQRAMLVCVVPTTRGSEPRGARGDPEGD